MNTTTRLAALLFGAAFGALLSWSGLTQYDVIQNMLLLRKPDVFLLMGSAIATGFIGVHLLRRAGVRVLATRQPVEWARARPTRDHVVGSVLFGLGWSIAGTCPGPAAAQLGQGQWACLFTLAGLFVGVAIRGYVQERRVAAQLRADAAGAIGM